VIWEEDGSDKDRGHWLDNYTYRTSLAWWIFVAAGSGSMLITILAESFQEIKAALASPVKNLRTE
jgi:putative ABC transport system permease protein